MSEYFRHARARRAGARLARSAAPGRRPIRHRRPHVGRHFEIAADGIRFVDPAAPPAEPSLWLGDRSGWRSPTAARVGAGARLHRAERRRYTADDFVATEGRAPAAPRAAHPRPGLYARLSEMHDCGLLGRIFPEFERIHCRVIRDFYHRYTVDEHTLLTIRNLESLRDRRRPGRERFSALLDEVHAPELLALALLYHDVGKWRDEITRGERAAGAADARAAGAPGRGAPDRRVPDRAPPGDVARRVPPRPRGPATWSRSSPHLVGTEERLKMLCLMTLVDIGAVSPDTLTPWKEELLWRLYVDTYNHLTLGYADELIAEGSGRPRRGDRRTPRRHLRAGADARSSTACRAAIWRCSAWPRSTGTSGWRATSAATRCTPRSRSTTTSGS